MWTNQTEKPNQLLRDSLAENYEPIAWAEELIEPARAVAHPRLAFLYVTASQCVLPGRIEAAVHYADAGQMAMRSGSGEVPYGFEAALGVAYVVIGQPERSVEWCRAQLARGSDTHVFTRATLVIALTFAGCTDDAKTAANGLIDAAEATGNPWALSFALFAYGLRRRLHRGRGHRAHAHCVLRDRHGQEL